MMRRIGIGCAIGSRTHSCRREQHSRQPHTLPIAPSVAVRTVGLQPHTIPFVRLSRLSILHRALGLVGSVLIVACGGQSDRVSGPLVGPPAVATSTASSGSVTDSTTPTVGASTTSTVEPLVTFPGQDPLRVGEAFRVGEEYEYTLRTYCGIEWAYVGGHWWRTEPLNDGNANPPAGWDNPSQAGRIHLEGPDTMVFTGGPDTIVFVRTELTEPDDPSLPDSVRFCD